MAIESEPLSEGVWLVAPMGRLDATQTPDLDQLLQNLIQAGHSRLLIDFSRVTFVASSGLRVLITARHDAMKSGGEVALVTLPPKVSDVLEMTGLYGVFRIFPARAEALAALSPLAAN